MGAKKNREYFVVHTQKSVPIIVVINLQSGPRSLKCFCFERGNNIMADGEPSTRHWQVHSAKLFTRADFWQARYRNAINALPTPSNWDFRSKAPVGTANAAMACESAVALGAKRNRILCVTIPSPIPFGFVAN